MKLKLLGLWFEILVHYTNVKLALNSVCFVDLKHWTYKEEQMITSVFSKFQPVRFLENKDSAIWRVAVPHNEIEVNLVHSKSAQ